MMKLRINDFGFSMAALLLIGMFVLGCQPKVQNQAAKPAPASASETTPLVEASLENVDLADFQELIAREGMQVLDVRTDGEVAGGMVETAEHLNVHGPDFRDKATEMLDKASPVVVYCRSGARSAKASAILQELGFKDIYNYTGGMNEWKAEGLPTVTK